MNNGSVAQTSFTRKTRAIVSWEYPMKSVLAKFAVVALSATALTMVTQKAHATIAFQIVGGSGLIGEGAFPGYGLPIGQDNVVNNGTAGLNPGGTKTVIDTNGTLGSSWLGSTSVSPVMLTVTGLGAGNTYTVSWSYLGSESNDVNKFTAGAISYLENNANNDCGVCATPGPTSPQIGTQFMGTSVTSNTTTPFTLTDNNSLSTISNGSGNPAPGAGLSNLIFSYATFASGVYSLTSAQTNIVVWGFNDNGAPDDNHDDFMGVATLLSTGSGDPTPLPAALPLFGSVLGGGLLFRRLRNRRQAGAKGAVA
jgi:hypothetical protein